MTVRSFRGPVATALSGAVGFVIGLVTVHPPALAHVSPSIEAIVPLSCTERVHDRLFFGLGTAAGTVSGGDWARFLAEVVTPRFPNGLTVVSAHGQWRGAGETDVTIEPSRVVEIAHDGGPVASRQLGEVISIYKRRHQQRSVMLARSRVEVCL